MSDNVHVDLAFLGQRMQCRDHGRFGVDLEKAAQVLPRVAAAEAVGAEHGGLLVQAAPEPDTPVHQRDLEHREHSDHGAAAGALFMRSVESTHSQVTDVGHEKQRSGGQPSVPLPEDPPGETAPHRADHQRLRGLALLLAHERGQPRRQKRQKRDQPDPPNYAQLLFHLFFLHQF